MNQVILITGGNSGIGLATAQRLMQSGCCVYTISRRGGKSQTAENGGSIHALTADVNEPKSLQQAVKQIINEKKHLDAVVCNAGNGWAGAIEETSDTEAKEQFETNFFGVLKTIQACMPIFQTQKYGRIITVSSIAGIIPIPFQAFYSAVKAALLSLSKTLSMELKPFGIQCCCILPGDTKTEFTASRKMTQASQNPNSFYKKRMTRSLKKMEHDEQNGTPPDKIAKSIYIQLNKNKMSAVCIPVMQYRFFALLIRFLPNKCVLRIVSMLYA